MPEPLDLDAIEERHGAYGKQHSHMAAFACCSAHASADDVPALVAEVRRLRELLDERTATIADKALENAELRRQLGPARAAGMREASAMLRAYCPHHGIKDTSFMDCHCAGADEIDRDAAAAALTS